jgi:hypothetical protein
MVPSQQENLLASAFIMIRIAGRYPIQSISAELGPTAISLWPISVYKNSNPKSTDEPWILDGIGFLFIYLFIGQDIYIYIYIYIHNDGGRGDRDGPWSPPKYGKKKKKLYKKKMYSLALTLVIWSPPKFFLALFLIFLV